MDQFGYPENDWNSKPIRIMSLTALVLQAISAMVFCIAHIIPKPFLTLVAPENYLEHLKNTDVLMHPLLFVGPMLQLIAAAGFCFMLLQEHKKPTSFSGVLLILIPAAAVVLSMVLMGASTVSNAVICRLYDADTMAVISLLNASISWIGILTAPVFPLLAAAAGFNRYRYTVMSQTEQS